MDLDNLARHLWLDENADYNTGDWWIICHPLTHQYIHDFDISYRRMEKDDTNVGFYVDTFDAKIGKSFPILSDRYMRPDCLLLVNFGSASYGYFANDKMDRKEIPTQGRYQRWLISFQTYGVVGPRPEAEHRHDSRPAERLALVIGKPLAEIVALARIHRKGAVPTVE